MVAKKSRSSTKKSSSKKEEQPPKPPPSSSSSSESEEGSEDDDMKLTLEALDAMSDSDESAVDSDAGAGDGDIEEEDEYSKEAEALRKMISDGKFDGLLKSSAKKGDGKKMKKDNKKREQKVASSDDDDDDDEFEELELGPNHLDTSLLQDEEGSDADDNNSKEQVYDQYWRDPNEDSPEEEELSSNENSENEEEEEDQAKQLEKELQAKKKASDIALQSAIQCSQRNLPWAETFAVVPPTPLPFGPPDTAAASSSNKKRKLGEEYDDEDEEEYVDIHDDLKREVAFYDNALEAVTLAREQCEKVGIPFTRPNDFFAEMVKSDDHMAKIKDRLIFETKKMEAVERRKSNKEQTVMAKERHAHRIAEKLRQKKEHMKSVEEWKKNAERNRGGLGGKVREDDEDQLGRMGGGGVNKKRMNANKKYGFGGKKSRFKQNDKSTLNDMSGFNPRGGFGGMGQKSSGGMGGGEKKGGGGKKRKGKRARDAGKR